MSYTINHYNGQSLIPGGLSDGAIDIGNTSLTLIGKDYAGYGQFLNENFVYLLENFAGGTGPANPISGQLWWDTTNNILKVWSGTSWKISTGATSSPYSTPPGDLSALGGDLWFDTTNQQLKVYSGSGWVVVGPAATSPLQTTGTFAAYLTDSSGGTHKVIQMQFDGSTYAIFSKDSFATTIPGFTLIQPGINFSTINPGFISTQSVNKIPNTLVQRDGTGSILAAAVTADSINATTISASSTINGTFSGNLTASTVTTNNLTSTIVNAGQVIATSALTGVLSTASQPYVTGLGTLNGLNVTGATNINGATALTGTATLNGSPIATTIGIAPYVAFNGIIGNVAPNTAVFTTVQVGALGGGGLTPASNLVVPLGNTTNYWSSVYAGTGTFAGALNSTSLSTGSAIVNGTLTAGNFVFANGASVVGATLAAAAAGVTNIPNSSLANSSLTINGVSISLGASGTVTAAAGTLSGSTLASGVTASSLTSVGTLNNLTVTNTISGSVSGYASYVSWGGVYGKPALVYNDGGTYSINISGSSSSARYADLAERFAADAVYTPGTVVDLGGSEEITLATEESVFGVISTDPGYLMNSNAGDDSTHPPVALAGRVPVRTIGIVNKGDYMVSAGQGLARSVGKARPIGNNIIGRAVENKTSEEEALVLTIVRLNI